MKDLENLKTNISERTHDAIEAGSQSLSEAQRKVGRKLTRLRAAGAKKMKAAESRVRAKPVQSVAVAFLAGAITSMIWGRR